MNWKQARHALIVRRHMVGLRQDQIPGLSRGMISLSENGTSTPKIESLIRWADALGWDVEISFVPKPVAASGQPGSDDGAPEAPRS